MSDFARSAKELSPAEKRALLEQALRKQARDAQTFPLSFAQERLWFLDQWEPQSAAHNIFTLLRLQGPLHISTLERCIAELIRRHAALRTIFLTIEGRPAQVIVPHQSVFLPLVDLSGVSPQEQTQQLQSLARQESERPFDLRRGPLLRTMLLRLYAAEHIFLVTMHHIISDGWSMGIFNRELGILYEAFSQGQPSPLPKLPIQYGSYARWQRRQSRDEPLQQHLAYWRKQLYGSPSLLALPTDRPRPPVQTFAGAIHQFILPQDQCDALKSLSQREHVTLFTMLLAAFQTLLARYSQQEDISVGTYIAGRINVQTEGLIGFFINNLVLRTDLSGDPPFRALLQQVSQVTQEAYEHQAIPFEQLLQELQPERNPSHTPLFQVMLIYQNMPRHELSLPGLTIQPLRIEGARTDFDLSLWVADTADQRLLLTFDYNTDLFDAATIKRMAGHLQILLQGIIDNPDRRLSHLSLLSETERQQVLHEWHATTVPFAHDAGIDQLIEAQVARTPDAIAVVCEEQHLSYAELNRRAEQLAGILQHQGVGPEVLVGICLERSPEMIISLLGVLKAGGAYVPLDPAYPQERLTFMIEQTRMPLLLTQRHLASRLPSSTVGKQLYLDTDWPAIAQSGLPLQQQNNTASQMAYVIYTSGSTGEPKGVTVEQHSLVNFTQAAARLFGIKLRERVLQFASLSFDASAEEIYPCLTHGGTLVLRTEMMLSDPKRFLQTCRDWGIRVLDLPTAYWHELAAALECEKLALPSCLRLVIIGGEQAQQERLMDWYRHAGEGTVLLNTYGPTETTVVATAHELRAAEHQGVSEAAVIGRAITNIEVYVLDQQGQPLPIGVPGDLYIGGEGVARGYLGQSALTAERFVPDPFSHRPGARLYRTGDRVRLLADGRLEYRGRLDRQVKLRGFRIELSEVEAVLTQHTAVREAAALLREDQPGEKRLVAYMVCQPTQSVGSSEMRNFLQQRLPSYMLPASFVQLETMPQTPNGKLDRRTLPAPQTLARAWERVWDGPRTPTEEVLAELWEAVLHVEQVGRHAHFFELGGHSLLATQLVARVREWFQVELPLRTIFDAPTLAELAEHISNQQPLQLPPLVASPSQEMFPLSYAQQRLWFLDQLQPGSPAYTIAVAVRFTGPLQCKLLHESLRTVVQRQPSLRTIFVPQQGYPIQRILPQLSLPLPLIDLSQLPAASREAVMARVAQQETQRPFNLAQGPLLRTTVLRLDEQTQILLLTMHHVITDAWSMGVLLQELAEGYRAALAQEPPRWPDLPIQYGDYACWQRAWLEDSSMQSQEGIRSPQEQQLAYWRSHLEGAPPLLELPTDHPRPQEQSWQGAHYSFALSSQLASELRQLCRQEGATLFMVLLTAFGVVLARYSGQDDLVIGTPIANRRYAQLEGLIGFFVNTLALRLSLAGRPTVRELLRRVREVALGAYAHQDVPFERVVEALHPQRALSHTPLFQVVFALQNVATATLELPDVHVQMLAMESGTARFDLTLTMQEYGQEIFGVLEYNRDLFAAETIQRMVRHLYTILEGMVVHPEQSTATLPLLTAQERQQILVEWNAAPPVASQELCLSQIFEQQVALLPDAVALVFEEEQLTYGELNARANRVAHYLRYLGVGPEILVGLYLEQSAAMIIAILGILKAGGAYLPLDPAYPPGRLALLLQDSQATALLSQQRLVERLPALSIPLVCLDRDWSLIAAQPTSPVCVPLHPEYVAYVIYTSGSTGIPKGVLVSHRHVTRLFASARAQIHFDQRDHWTLFHSIAFDFSVWELWGALLFGGRLVLVPFWQSREPERFLDLLVTQQITVLNQTPLAFRQLVAVVSAAASVKAWLALRYIIFGGEALDLLSVQSWWTHVAEHSPRLINMYGITETTVHVTCLPLSREVVSGELVSPIGRPLSDLEVYVLDRAGQPVPVGVIGELYVGGAGVTRGYLGRPELTAERFVPHPWSAQPGARLYRSGDLARYRVDGQLEYLGRNDAQVKLRGFRIELGEIEAALREHPAVRETVVTIQERQQGEKQLVAYLVPMPEQTPSLSALRAFLSTRLPIHMLPAAFVPLERLPLTSNGKLDRRGLPDPDSTRPELGKRYTAPHTEIERALAQIWSQVLRVQQVGVHDNFFELGGDSILSIQVVTRARAAGLLLTPRHLFQQQTIAQLATVVESTGRAPGEAEAVTGSMPLMPIHHWFFEQSLAEPQHWNQALLLQARQKLEPALLAQALHAVVSQHDALRLRAHHQPEGWQLVFAAPDEPVTLLQVDLSGLPAEQRRTTLEAAANVLQASLNHTDGPIMRVALFDLGAGQPARLLLLIHHLVIDIVSWSILLEDLQSAYQQLEQGQSVCLPTKTTSFQQWSHHLQAYAQSTAIMAQRSYWLGQAWEQVRPLPLDLPDGQDANSGDSARSLVVALSVEQTRALLSEVPRAYHTQINDVLLTALVQAFARWTGEQCLLVQLEGHGREDLFEEVDLSRTMGWCTSLIPLVLSLPAKRGPEAALMQIKEQLRALPQGGIGFGLIRYLSQDAALREQLAVLPQPQVSFNYAGRSAFESQEEGILTLATESAGISYSHENRRLHILEINGGILQGQLYLEWIYSNRLHQHTTIERLAQSCIEALEELIAHCQSPDAGGYTPSDFPLARLDEQKLRELSLLLDSADEL